MHHNISGFNVCLSALFYARDEVLLLLLLDLIRPLESAPTVVLIESPASALWVCVALVLTPSMVFCFSLLLLLRLTVVPGQEGVLKKTAEV